MLTLVILLGSLAISGWCSFKAVQARTETAEELRVLLEGVEVHTRSEDDSAESHKSSSPSTSGDVSQLVRDAFQENERQISVLALSELISQADFLRSNNRELARGLPRISFLGAVGACIGILALGGLSENSLMLGGISAVCGALSGVLAGSVMKNSLSMAQQFSDVASSISHKIQAQWEAA